ncbi:MAG TPA: glycosyltransferase [Tepidisphaeraceae bacterium]|jgi:glycosyltransferase involved in cell wall biosynthesis
MVEAPPLSVVMAVRNVQRYVALAIESVLSQTFKDFEFLVIDDGSTDNTSSILADYARRDSRIRIIQGPSGGLSAALNLGIAQARAPLIARMDGDDICLPTRFEKQIAFLQSHPEHVLVGSRCVLIDPDGRPIHEKPNTPLGHEQIDAMLLKMEWPIVHPAVMMRADAFAKAGAYLEKYKTVEDHDVFLKLAEIGKLANLDEVLMYYRQHFKSTVYTTVNQQRRNLTEITTDACARRGIPVPPEVVERPVELVSEAQHRRNWVWRALAAGNKATARHHAWAVVRAAPLSAESWRAMICAIRGR